MSIHWGDQYIHMPNAQQRQLAKDLLASPDVDLILGDHVHVVQPCEKIGDKYVMYGMGNFLSNQSPTQDRTLKNDNQDGSLETYTIDETAPGHVQGHQDGVRADVGRDPRATRSCWPRPTSTRTPTTARSRNMNLARPRRLRRHAGVLGSRGSEVTSGELRHEPQRRRPPDRDPSGVVHC